LLVGETGTGKEVLAQGIHRWSGRRGELVDVDCGALATGMVVAELFGHRRGAYTTAVDSMPGLLEQAAQGTLFLDELASLPAEGQAALMRVLETGEVRRVGDRAKQHVDIRLLAAVHDDIGAPGGLGRLRSDLFHRLAGTVIHLPPLRDRTEDLLPLARHLAAAQGRSVPDSVLGLLERHHWPGNVRELRHVIARAASLSDTRELGAGHFAEALDLGVRRPPARMDPNVLFRQSGLAAEHRRLLELCQRHEGKPDAIAAELGVSRSTLFRRLREAGISLRRGVSAGRSLETG
jgi:transcriptional regulator with PAS, ATPase and Fis domain